MLPDPSLVGRFVVRSSGMTHTGLAAHEVVELFDARPSEAFEAFRIHRVDDSGQMELVGVAKSEFRRTMEFTIALSSADAARAAFTAIVSHAESQPPPCRTELRQFISVAGGHAITLIAPAACVEPIGHWLAQVEADSSETVRKSFDDVGVHQHGDDAGDVVDQTVLEPYCTKRLDVLHGE